MLGPLERADDGGGSTGLLPVRQDAVPEPEELQELEEAARNAAALRDIVLAAWGIGDATDEERDIAEGVWKTARLAWLEAANVEADRVRRGLLILATFDPNVILEVLASVGVDVRKGLAELRKQTADEREELNRLAAGVRMARDDLKALRRDHERLRTEIDGLRVSVE